MAITFPNLNPSPDDSKVTLLRKILQRLNGLVEPADGEWDLLYRLLALLNAATSGGGAISFVGDVSITGDLDVSGIADVNHLLATCLDAYAANHAAIKGVGGANVGVFGTASSDTAEAVLGVQGADGVGVHGSAALGIGVRGDGLIGVQAFSNSANEALVANITGAATNIATFYDDPVLKAAITKDGMFVGAGAVPTPVVDDDVAGATATNAALSCHFRYTLTDNITLSNPTGAVDGQRIVWELIQDNTGNRTLALDGKFAFGTDIPSATLSTTGNKRDFLTVVYNATADKFYVVAFVKGF